MTPRRPSPILLPEGPDPGRPRGVVEWLRGLLKRKRPEAGEARQEDGEGEERDASLNASHRSPQRDTIQLLPGRLEPLLPEVIQQEVRFQRASSSQQEVTLGWELGEPPHHVTLDHPSIQPLHAKMTYQNGRWMIESLAPHDPVEVNGTPVPSAGGPYLLANGDQIRIGEALFRFHQP